MGLRALKSLGLETSSITVSHLRLPLNTDLFSLLKLLASFLHMMEIIDALSSKLYYLQIESTPRKAWSVSKG